MKKTTSLSIHRYIREHVWLFPVAFCLRVLAWLLFGVNCLRKNFLMKRAISSKKIIISVGSVTVGGSGKTPVILFLMNTCAHARMGYVSRGYGRHEHKDIVAKASSLSSSTSIGDEAYLIGTHFPSLILGIGRSKKRMVQQMETQPIDILFLDDGLQRYDIRPSYEIGVIPDHLLFEKEDLFPYGMFREPLDRLKRVDLLFVVRENFERSLDELIQAAEQFLPHHFVVVEQKLHGWKAVDGSSVEAPKGPVVVLSGIARPERCVALLEKEGYRVVDTRFVGDHESVVEASCVQWARSWHEQGVPVVITEKDWARHVPWSSELSFCFIFLVELFPQTSDNFWKKVFNNCVGIT